MLQFEIVSYRPVCIFTHITGTATNESSQVRSTISNGSSAASKFSSVELLLCNYRYVERVLVELRIIAVESINGSILLD